MSCTCSDCYEGCDWDCPECGPSFIECTVGKVRSSVGRLGRRFMSRRLRKTSTASRADFPSGERVIDMDDVIAMLDPDESQFITMLMKLTRGDGHRLTIAEADYNKARLLPGQIIEYHRNDMDPGLWRVESVRHDDDWFSGKVFIMLRRPWQERTEDMKVAWLENEIMPRLAQSA